MNELIMNNESGWIFTQNIFVSGDGLKRTWPSASHNRSVNCLLKAYVEHIPKGKQLSDLLCPTQRFDKWQTELGWFLRFESEK